MSIEVQVFPGLEDRLRGSVTTTVEKLSHYIRKDTPLGRELRSKFEEAIADIGNIEIGEFGSGSGSFFVSRGTLSLPEGPIAKLLYAVMDDISCGGEQDSFADTTELFAIFDRVLAGFVLHELRHRTQGMEVYARVADVRATGGEMVMAQLDALADRDAAVAVAAINVAGDSRDEFLEMFQDALYLSSAYYFRVFPIPRDRPDKVARALGVLLMLARLATAKTSGRWNEDPKFPLDAPLYAYLKSDTKLLTFWRGEPSPELIGFSNDAASVDELVNDVVEGRFTSAIAKCIRLLRRIGTIR